MKDEALDFLPMILLLGLVVSISFRLIMPIYRESQELVYTERYDKTLQKIEGEQYYSNNSTDPNLTYEEAILEIGSQSYFMPAPRVIDVGGKVFAIQPNSTSIANPEEAYTATATDEYIPGNRASLAMIKDAMYKWCTDYTARYGKDGFKLKFAVRFTTSNIEGESDDCYSLYIVAIDKKGDQFYLRCKDNGYVETPDPSIDYYIPYYV